MLNNTHLSDSQKREFLQKFDINEQLQKASASSAKETVFVVSPMTNDFSGFLNVPYRQQETNYWCGPATTQQTLTYINGYANSQSSIANAIGTTSSGSDLASMVPYINNHESRNYYIIVTSPSESLIQSIAEYGVRSSAPPIGRLKIQQGGNWEYSSSGHYMNISGYTGYGDYIRVTDPYIGWVDPTIANNSNGSYFVTSNEFYTATANHWAHQISY